MIRRIFNVNKFLNRKDKKLDRYRYVLNDKEYLLDLLDNILNKNGEFIESESNISTKKSFTRRLEEVLEKLGLD